MANQRHNRGGEDEIASRAARTAANLVLLGALALSLLSPHAIMTACLAASIYGAWCLATGQWKWESRDHPAAAVNLSMVVFAVGSAAICRLKGEPPGEMEPYLALLCAPLLGIGLRQLAPRPSAVAVAIAAAALLGSAVALWQTSTATGMQRASTHIAATTFGMLGAVYAVLCVAMSSWTTEDRRVKILLGAGAAAGVVVALLSGSRGAWVILAIVLPVAVLSGVPTKKRRNAIAFGAALAAVAVAAALLPNNPVGDRFRETLRVGDPLRTAFSRESLKAFVSAPWFGVPREDFAGNLDRAWLSVRPYAPHENPPQHSHNELLDAAAVRGAAGFALNLFVLAVPVVVLWRLAGSEPGRGPATTGLLFMAAFLLAGTTDLLLQLTARRMTFLFVVLFCVITATGNGERKSPTVAHR